MIMYFALVLPSTLLSLLVLLVLNLDRVSCAPVAVAIAAPAVRSRPQQLQQSLYDDNVSSSSSSSFYRIPTRYESTVLGRRLLALSSTGTLATIFPSNVSSQPRLPQDLSHTPIGLPDYLADCEPDTGNPTLLALTVSTATKNALAGSNVSLSLSWWDQYSKLTHHEPWSAANLPRLSMVGYLEEISKQEVEDAGIVECYTSLHADSRLWLPGDSGAAHAGLWMRLVVREVYWIGGFGDRNFIGWFDADEWRGIGEGEWRAARLPGEL